MSGMGGIMISDPSEDDMDSMEGMSGMEGIMIDDPAEED
jgi:hypothetical protein